MSKLRPTLRGRREGGKAGPSEAVVQISAARENLPRSPVLRGRQGPLPGASGYSVSQGGVEGAKWETIKTECVHGVMWGVSKAYMWPN